MTRGRPSTARCGTPSGYKAHLKRGEQTCDACKKAVNDYQQHRARTKRDAIKRGQKTDRIMRAVIESRFGHVSERWEFDSGHPTGNKVIQLMPWAIGRSWPYPHYQWEKQEVRDYLVPLQPILAQLFPYNSERK